MITNDTNSKNITIPSHEKFARALELWVIYNPRYSTNVDTYLALLQRKRDLGIKPLRKIPEYILKEYPDIPYLKLETLGEAQAYLGKLNAGELTKLIHHIEYIVCYDHAYRTVSERVVEFQYQVDHYSQRSAYGIDPDSISSRRRGRNHKMDDKK